MNKILFFDPNLSKLLKNTSYPAGGAAVQAHNWILGLLEKNVRIGVLTDLKPINSDENLNIDFVPTYNESKYESKLRWIFYKYRILKRVIIDYDPDYIYQAGAGFITWVLSYIAKKNDITFIHRIANDIDTDEKINNKLGFLTRAFYKKGLNNSDIIFCQNEKQFSNIKEIYKHKRVYILHNPISINHKKILKLIDRQYIAWLGIFQFQKNLPGLFQIAKYMPEYQFNIGGVSSSDISFDTQTNLNNLKKLPNVLFEGFISHDQVNKFLGSAYLLLNTSHYEGFSNTFLESFLSGTPIVTLNNVDPDNIIEKNNLGYIGQNISQLPSLIKRLITNNNYEAMSSRCQRYVIENHDANKLSTIFLKYIAE